MSSLYPVALIAAKAAVLLVLTAVVALAARHASAAIRHLIWSTGLAATLLLPTVPFAEGLKPSRFRPFCGPVGRPPSSHYTTPTMTDAGQTASPPPPRGIRHLSRAPINEAIIDWRVAPVDPIDSAVLKRLADDVQAEYPHLDEQTAFEATLAVAAADGQVHHVANSEGRGVHGYTCKTSDRLTMIQFRRDGFTLNRLRPYTKWDDVFPEALKHWRRYRAAIGNAPVVRLAVRYINTLSVPAKGDIGDFLTAPPRLPAEVPQVVEAFQSMVVIRDESRDLRARLTQALQSGPRETEAVVVLDIDAYAINEAGFADDAVEPALWKLHDYKNEIFFGAVNADYVDRTLA